jgi:hypothetical protein
VKFRLEIDCDGFFVSIVPFQNLSLPAIERYCEISVLIQTTLAAPCRHDRRPLQLRPRHAAGDGSALISSHRHPLISAHLPVPSMLSLALIAHLNCRHPHHYPWAVDSP